MAAGPCVSPVRNGEYDARRSPRRRLCLVAVSLALTAQTPECSAYVSNARRVCAAAVDGTRAFHPLIGVLVSGGNPTIGSAGTLGGLGQRPSLTLRANAVELVLPDLAYNGGASRVPAGDKFWAPGSAGRRRPRNLSGHVRRGSLAIDLLGSAQLLPTDQIDNFTVDAGRTEDRRRGARPGVRGAGGTSAR